MRTLIGILALAAVVALVQGYARTEGLNGSMHEGVVERVFVEQDLGVYVDRESAPGNRAGTTWVDVKFPEPLADGSTGAIAFLPADLRVEPGDLVEMRFAGGNGAQTDAAQDQNCVLALVQRHGSVTRVSTTGNRVSPAEHRSRALVGL
jgi:hypothetical protein